MISPEAYQYVAKKLYEGHYEELVTRKVVAPNPNVKPGHQETKRYQLDEIEEEAEILAKGDPYPQVRLTGGKVVVPIHKIALGVSYDEWDIESAKLEGWESLESKAPKMVGRKIAEKEDTYLLRGNTEVGTSGLYGSATNTAACSVKWDQTNCDPFDDFNKAVGKLEEDGFSVDFAIFNSANFYLIRQKDAFGNSYLEMIMDSFQLKPENILKTSGLTSGTGLIGQMGNDYAELNLAEDLFVKPPEIFEDTVKINSRLKVGLDVIETDAFCTITNIV